MSRPVLAGERRRFRLWVCGCCAAAPRPGGAAHSLCVRQGAPQCGAAEASKPLPRPAGGAAAAGGGPCARGLRSAAGAALGALPPRPLPAAGRTPPLKGGVRAGDRDEGAALPSPRRSEEEVSQRTEGDVGPRLPWAASASRDVAEQGKPGANGKNRRCFLTSSSAAGLRCGCGGTSRFPVTAARSPGFVCGTPARSHGRKRAVGTGCCFSLALHRSGSGRTELSFRPALARALTAQKRLRWEQRPRAPHRFLEPRWWLCEARPGTGREGRPGAAGPSGAVFEPGGAVWGKLILTEEHGRRVRTPRRGECPDSVRWDRGDGSGGIPGYRRRHRGPRSG
ncbi:collagen alpha-2(I) chain-like isoform X2 [Lathamus discolor]|uniref:collagen alpha-2(I) chain-like isoform X2 n=1 Tax=Lathamus discolor TaxID=678569 RepID=UPI0032B8460A